ncbi:hypothetical protein K443DRAFT_14562 [Laccaria amethystina LaAM-08-1]|uniref:Uncharacterized protein n=1 Tax=Laccaria amethystina LaAM-08-1 TaxID=1095629 RepID=A0A0C9WMM1_9AGAR|nr:hypothetical protein K443DRAFT_14562 [Laccaria amethystina LaAM-08-1]
MSISLAQQLPEYARYADAPPCYDPEKALKDFNALTPEQKGKLEIAVARVASSNEADQEFKKASASAATAVQTIDTLFVTLTAKLTSLSDTQNFLDEFKTIQQIFRGIVKDSHTLAITIAQYADSFDGIIVQFCADESVTVDERIAKIKIFIGKSESIKTDAGNMQKQFDGLKDRFSKFVGSFSDWSKLREEADQEEIKNLYDEIKKLDEKIKDIDTAMKVLAAALAATLPITGILAICFPPAAPFIMGAGCILAGLELTSLVGLAIAKNILLNEKLVKEHRIKDLQDEIIKIKATRTQLEKDGQVALMTSVIQNVWTKVLNDANYIQKWLEEGADNAKYPKYMKASLEEGVKVYNQMGKYLRGYADGVTKTVETFKV